ncbi:hypothetical protein ACFLZS_01785 [Patescibacteria group bacterium]
MIKMKKITKHLLWRVKYYPWKVPVIGVIFGLFFTVMVAIAAIFTQDPLWVSKTLVAATLLLPVCGGAGIVIATIIWGFTPNYEVDEWLCEYPFG